MQLEAAFGVDIGDGEVDLLSGQYTAGDVVCVSAKTGVNIEELLMTIVARTPPPQGEPMGMLRAALVRAY